MSESQSVLVTGGGGFIGRAVCSRLAVRGVRVLCVDRRKAAGQGAGILECDIADPRQLESVFQGRRIDAIVHLASLLPTASKANPRAATDVNILGGANLLEAAGRFGVRRIVYGSSISVYGQGGADPVSETTPAAPEDLYGAAKRYVELLGAAYRQTCGAGFVSLRIAMVVGPGAGPTSSLWRSGIFEALSARRETEVSIPYGPEEEAPLVHVDDVADALILLVQARQPAFDLYNAPSQSWSFAQLKQEAEQANGNVRVRLGTERVCGIPQLVDGTRFAAEFGYAPTPLKDRLHRCAAAGSFSSA